MMSHTFCTKKIGIFIFTIAFALSTNSLFVSTTHAEAGKAAADTLNKDVQLSAELNKEEAGHDFGCFGGGSKGMFDGCAALLAYYFMKAGGALAIWVGTGLNWVIQYLIIGMGQLVGNLYGITVAWGVLRDLANVFLVFITVLIGMSMIVGATTYGSKQLLFKVVIAALFVNFSITLTKAVIDVTNIFTVATYQMFLNETGSSNVDVEKCLKSPYNSGTEAKNDPCVHTGVAGIFVSKLEVLTLLNYTKGMNNEQKAAAASEVMWLGLMGGIMFFVMAFVFGAAAVLLVIRFAVLCVLIIFSPIAFVLWVTGISGQGKQWWNTLLSQSLLAPALMLMWWIAFMIFNGFNIIFPDRSQIAKGGLMNGGESVAPIVIVAQFFVLIAIFIMSLIVARSMASHGGAMLVNATDRYAKRGYGMAMRPVRAVGRGTRDAVVDNTWGRGMSAYAKHTKKFEAKAFETETKADGTTGYVNNSARARLARGSAKIGVAGALNKATERQGAKFDARKKAVESYKGELTAELNKQKVAGAAELAGKYGEHTESALEAEIRAKNANFDTTQVANERQKVEEARKIIGGLSKKDAEALHGEIMKNVESVIHMSASQIEAIMNSDAYTGEEKEKIRTTKYANEIGILGSSGPLTADQSAKINALGNKDLDLLRKELLSKKEMAEYLNGDQMDYILNKSDAYTAQEKTAVRKGRFAKLDAELAKVKDDPRLGTADLEKELNKLSDKEAELLEQQFIEDQTVIESMPQRVAEKVMASPRIANATKSKIKDGRSAYFKRVADGGAGKTTADILKGRSAADVAKIDGEQLKRREYVQHMNVAMLSASASTLNTAQKAEVRAHVATLMPPVRSAFDSAVARELSSIMTPGRTTPLTQLEEASIKRKAMATLNPDERRMIEVDDWLNSTTAGAIF